MRDEANARAFSSLLTFFFVHAMSLHDQLDASTVARAYLQTRREKSGPRKNKGTM
jgi:hypothetical protein